MSGALDRPQGLYALAPAAQPMGQQDMLARLLRGNPDPSLPGYPVMQSSEGRGFRPIPFQGEGFQRMAAVLRGDVEPTPGEQMGMNVVRGFTEGPATIRAFHGSPHRFDRFDMSRIGTGEGAQAYGHGLYFAGNEGVARSYRDALTAKVDPRTGINNLLDNVGFGATRPDIEEAAAGLGLRLQKTQLDDIAAALGGRNSDGTVTASALNALRRLEDSLPKTQGAMYEVNLNTTPDRLLDWDAPISQQSPEIQPVLRQMLESARKSFPQIDPRGNPIGGQVHNLYQQHRGGHSDFVTEEMKRNGIPGIQYLDAGSRATSGGELLGVTQGPKGWQAKIRVDNRGGTAFADPTQQITTSRPFQTQADAQAWADSQINAGTRNYVMFDDKLIDILRRYGVAGTLGGGAAATSGTSE